MARLLSVNVGLPRDIEWKGRIVRTAIWKEPVPGRCRVTRLNLEGDGQGDTAGHGGEQRAVFVYQMGSYRYWQAQLHRTDFVFGQFGENFTVEGLADDAVCIGDRYRIGSAVFEVTQPRVTCYRVGIRMDEPRMPALLTSSGRPGFYFRVLQEGDVGAGDEIIQLGAAAERMTVTEINALLYSSDHAHDRLERALLIEPLALGWRKSFEALLQGRPRGGNAGLTPEAAAHPAAPGFHSLRVSQVDEESADVLSFTLQRTDGQPVTPALPGQYVVVRLPATTGGQPIFRSYSLSGPASSERYRISVKIEPNGVAGSYLHENVHVDAVLDVSAPRGSFILTAGERPLVLLSAGIGATPVLAMLYALELERSVRPVLWVHAARDGEHHPFAAEVNRLVHALANARSYVCYSQPASNDTVGRGCDSAGHLSQRDFDALSVSPDADVYLCGPNRFMADMRDTLARSGVASERIHVEIFNGGDPMTPGISGEPRRAPHLPSKQSDIGVRVAFARSGITVRWDPATYRNILELAEACDVPVRWSCRSGVCHSCESGLVSGSVAYAPAPLDEPADGDVLICCSQPTADVVVDL